MGDVKDKYVLMVDDMIDTAGTLCNAAEALVQKGGARQVMAAATMRCYPARLWNGCATAPSTRWCCWDHHRPASGKTIEQIHRAALRPGICGGHPPHRGRSVGVGTI